MKNSERLDKLEAEVAQLKQQCTQMAAMLAAMLLPTLAERMSQQTDAELKGMVDGR